MHYPTLQVLDRVRAASAAAKVPVALMLDTKGPEIRTAMLRDHKNIQLVKGECWVVGMRWGSCILRCW